WTIDTVAPQTTITMGPPPADNSVIVHFSFMANEMNCTFECSLDGSSYSPCATGDAFGPLADGAHSFAVRARDRAGNVDPAPATRSWSVDNEPPDTVITSGPSGTMPSMSAGFTFTASEPATFACSLDASPYAPCTSPYDASNLAQGQHTFAVRATDG